jgi:hypothetical protein
MKLIALNHLKKKHSKNCQISCGLHENDTSISTMSTARIPSIGLTSLQQKKKHWPNLRTYIYFLETQYRRKRSHTRTHTHPYQHIYATLPVLAPSRD